VIEKLEKTPIVVKAGETATIKVPCKGNPPPSAVWYHDGEEILPVKVSWPGCFEKCGSFATDI